MNGNANKKKAVGLMSLVDVVFLLLVFFLVVSIFVNSEQNEFAVRVGTPEEIEGEANILIQVTADGNFFFIDDTYFREIENFLKRQVYTPSRWRGKSLRWRASELKKVLKAMGKGETRYGSGSARKTIPRSLRPLDKTGIKNRIYEKVKKVDDDNSGKKMVSNYFVLVRCPAGAPYGDALTVIDAIRQAGPGAQYFQYGISGGSLADFSERGELTFEPDDPYPPVMFIKFEPGKVVEKS